METGRIQYGEEEVEDWETQGMQGMQEEVNPRNVTTVEKEDTLPENVTNPREESERCKMETKMLIIF